ncbi:MAG: DUF1129 domain-containing protein [Bombilactobacillus mellifer]|nr:DUF1129 domain-containing protein [Bombilactobacillus mellifer]
MSKKKQTTTTSTTHHKLSELTKRNEEYVFQLKKTLVNEHKYSSESADKYINSILDEIVTAQQKGLPANRLYGSPRKKAESYVKGEKEKPSNSFPLLWLDNSIIFALLLSAMTSLVIFTSNNKTTANSNGIMTIILMAAEFGLPWAYFTLWTLKPKDNRASVPKLVGIIALGFVGLFIVVAIATILPPQLNPVFNGWIYLILAGVLFGIHYYLKHKYNIKGTLF